MQRCMTLEEKFWAKVERRGVDDCWPWLASKDRDGYGQIGRSTNHPRTLAHRFSWSLANGKPIPRGQWILHRCDTPSCVNPKHLYCGTPKNNVDDCIERGRFVHGGLHPNAKLTSRDVRRIFKMRANGLSQNAIADRVNSSQQNISRILRGEMWFRVAADHGIGKIRAD